MSLLCVTVLVELHQRRSLVSLVYYSLRRAGHAGGSGSVRVCAQPEMPNDIPLVALAGREGPMDPERPEDPKGPEKQQMPDGTNLPTVPDVPMRAQPQSQQPQPQPEPRPQRTPATRESCNTDLAARSNSIVNSITKSTSTNTSNDLSMERPTEPCLRLVVPEVINTTTGNSTICTTVDNATAATDAEAVGLAPAAPELLAATNPIPTPTVRVNATSCEGISSTEIGGGATACGGVRTRSKPLPEGTIPMPMQTPMQMMHVPMQMNMQVPSVEAEPPPPTVPIPADLKRGSCEV